MKRAWTLDGKKVWLHPPFWSRRRSHPVRLALRDAEWLPGGEWWPLLRDRSGEVIASEVPSDNVASVEACPEGERELRVLPKCELVDRVAALSVVADDRWTEAQIDALLEDPFIKTRERLARHYWFSEELRRVVAQHIVNGKRDSRTLGGAMDVASRARDASLWEFVAKRASAGDRVARHILKTWPDERGVEFFERAFSDRATDEDAHSELSAVTFFVRCCRDHGLAPLVAHLGDPWDKVENERIVDARNWLGAELNDCEESGARVSAAWAEYLASLLLGTRVIEEWGRLSKSLALLRRRKDPRLPVLIWRFIHDRVDVEESIVSCLTSVRSAESKRIARALAEQLSQQATRARGERARERFERVGDLVGSALAAMES